MFARTPLAWKNLTHDLRRLVVASCGVAFAVLLMFMEMGFLNALLDSTVQLIRRLRGDLVIASSAKFAMLARERFPGPRLQQARTVADVEVYPVYLETLAASLRHRDKARPIRVIAFELEDRAITLEAVEEQLSKLRPPFTALYDEASKPDFGFPDPEEDLSEYEAELSGRRLELVGSFRLSTDFANDGNLIMSAANFERYFPTRAGREDPLSLVDLGVVHLKDPSRAQAVKRKLERGLPNDVQVFTKSDFIDRERAFWRTSTPVGYIFFVGEVIGFVVGVIICYQIIYSDLDDHMGEFATLKAMGYDNRYFVVLVFWESLYLALLGFVPGAIVSFFLYSILARWTGLFMVFRWDVALTVLVVTIAMCAVSGLLALRKLLRADPASLFK